MIIKLNEDYYLGKRLSLNKHKEKPERKNRQKMTAGEYFKKTRDISGWFRPLERTK